MQRVTLLGSYGAPINLRFGAEIRVPMQFGAITPELTADFSRRDEALPAEPRLWPLDFEDEEMRSCLLPNEVAAHYFGDPRAGTDAAAVRAQLIPSFNNERERVARTWGDYFYADKDVSGNAVKYATIRIGLPRVPKVEVCAVNAAGRPVGEWRFLPHEHWKFEETLDSNHAAMMAEFKSRRGIAPTIQPAAFNLADLKPEQIAELRKLLMASGKPAAASAT